MRGVGGESLISVCSEGSEGRESNFSWLGSEGREEETLVTDQDNAIVFAKDDEGCAGYFERLGKQVCGWLDAAGYRYCKGDVMAGEPLWCFARVTEKGRDITREDGRAATEPLGPVAGDSSHETYAFPEGVQGHFASQKIDRIEGAFRDRDHGRSGARDRRRRDAGKVRKNYADSGPWKGRV